MGAVMTKALRDAFSSSHKDYVAGLIMRTFGPRCPQEFSEDEDGSTACEVCQAWAWFDKLFGREE